MAKLFVPSAHRDWHVVDRSGVTVWAIGHAFRAGELLSGDVLAAAVAEQIVAGTSIVALLKEFSGQFALVIQQGETLWLGADVIRSVPLFYRCDATLASDEIASLFPSGEYAPDSMVEYATAGFITGPHTLYDDVCTVQAGEIVRLHQGQTESGPYYNFRNDYSNDIENGTVLEGLDAAVMHSMARAVEVCAGRQVVIPLSGGLDSRLIAASFKRLGYDNIICFSYGLKDNWEATKAQSVAETLQIPWFPVEFTHEQLKRDYYSKEMRRFWHYAGQGSTLPSVPEWPGVRLAVQDKRVDKDAVFLSGQSGDFINGSHLKYLFDPAWHKEPLDVLGAIRNKHYSLWRDLAERPLVRSAVSRRIREVLQGFEIGTMEQAAQAYEYWECLERQLKYVVPGGRVFEFFGHEWWMPLWDREIIDFFKPVSIGLKMEGYLYAKYLGTFDPYGVFQENCPKARFDRSLALADAARKNTPRKRLKRVFERLPGIRSVAVHQRYMREHRHYYRYNPLGFPRIYEEQEYVKTNLGKKHVLSLWLKDFLQAEYALDIRQLEKRLFGGQ